LSSSSLFVLSSSNHFLPTITISFLFMHIDTFISHLIMTNLKLPSPSSSSQDERTGDETTVSSISNVGDDDDSWQSKKASQNRANAMAYNIIAQRGGSFVRKETVVGDSTLELKVQYKTIVGSLETALAKIGQGLREPPARLSSRRQASLVRRLSLEESYTAPRRAPKRRVRVLPKSGRIKDINHMSNNNSSGMSDSIGNVGSVSYQNNQRPMTPDPLKGDTEWNILIRHKQLQRLLLLQHSAKCTHEDGRRSVTPHCADMNRLWKYMEGCKDNQCRVAHCFSSRTILSHYRKCKDPSCLGD
jgi:hypothetical protein